MSLASSGTILSVYEQNWIIMAKDLESPYKTPFGIKEIKRINNRDTVRKMLLLHARQKFEEIPCFSVANKDQLTTCRCLECFLEDKELVEQLLDLLQEYAYLSLDACHLFLHGIVTNAFLQKEFNSKGEKRVPTFLLNGVSSDSFLQTYLCMNAFRQMFYIGRRQWKQMMEMIHIPKQVQRSHLKENARAISKACQRVIDFLYDIAVTEGESYATRYVRLLTGIMIRDTEKGHTELPSSYTIRQLYKRFCYHSGYIAKSDAVGWYPKIESYKK